MYTNAKMELARKKQVKLQSNLVNSKSSGPEVLFRIIRGVLKGGRHKTYKSK